ncbi:hypothetical protein [Burkholderia puraquae]|uniref:hypothetical protein n=1 Tax=Burkholderia puraquae TaxID=1904757 RepID=UPI001FCAC88F|nr:hypothetical protein [Burkholderia puraquae]
MKTPVRLAMMSGAMLATANAVHASEVTLSGLFDTSLTYVWNANADGRNLAGLESVRRGTPALGRQDDALAAVAWPSCASGSERGGPTRRVTKISCSDQVREASCRYDRKRDGQRPFQTTQAGRCRTARHALGPDTSSAGPFFVAFPTIRALNFAEGTGNYAFLHTGSDCRSDARHSRSARRA